MDKTPAMKKRPLTLQWCAPCSDLILDGNISPLQLGSDSNGPTEAPPDGVDPLPPMDRLSMICLRVLNFTNAEEDIQMVATQVATSSSGWEMPFYASPVATHTNTQLTALQCTFTEDTATLYRGLQTRGGQPTPDASSAVWRPSVQTYTRYSLYYNCSVQRKVCLKHIPDITFTLNIYDLFALYTR